MFITKIDYQQSKNTRNLNLPRIKKFQPLSVRKPKHKWLVVCWYYWERSESNKQVVDAHSIEQIRFVDVSSQSVNWHNMKIFKIGIVFLI